MSKSSLALMGNILLSICVFLLSVLKTGIVSYHFVWKKEPFFPLMPWRHHYQTSFSWVLVPKQHLKSMRFEAQSTQIHNRRKSHQQKDPHVTRRHRHTAASLGDNRARPHIENWQISVIRGWREWQGMPAFVTAPSGIEWQRTDGNTSLLADSQR